MKQIKYIGQKFLFLTGFITLLFFGFLFFVGNVNAAENEKISGAYNNNNNNTFEGTITSGTNQILYCHAHFGNNLQSANLYWGTQQMTSLYQHPDNSYFLNAAFVLVNPNVGTYFVNSTSNGLNGVVCIVKENIDQENPFATSTTWADNQCNNRYATPTKEDNIIFAHTVGNNNTVNWDNFQKVYTNTPTNLYFSLSDKVATSTNQILFSSPECVYYWFIELNYFANPFLDNYIYITDFGSTDVINILNSPVNFKYIYDICDTFTQDNEYIIAYEVGGTEISRQQISSSQCSTEYFNQATYYATSLATSTGTSTLKIYTKPYELNAPILEDDLSILTEIASSQEFTSIVDTTAKAPFVSPRFNPYILPVGNGATTTSVHLIYDYCDSTFKDNVDKICLNNDLDSCVVPTACYGGVDVSLPVGAIGSSIVRYPVIIDDSLEWLFTGDVFTISFSASGYVDSPDECDSEASWFSESFCEFKRDFLTPTFSNLVDTIAIMFPFNIIKNIDTAFKNSENAPLPSQLAFLPFPDSQGNIYVEIPDRFSGGTDIEMCIFGKCVFEKTTGLKDFFTGLRWLSYYGFYLIFIFALYKFAKNLYKEIVE
jgi:hypothetical protein